MSSLAGKHIRIEVQKMVISRQHLHTLVDMVEESGLATLYEVMIRFIPEDEAAPDEVAAIAEARAEYERGETVRLDDLRQI